jgi:hypothetical protein
VKYNGYWIQTASRNRQIFWCETEGIMGQTPFKYANILVITEGITGQNPSTTSLQTLGSNMQIFGWEQRGSWVKNLLDMQIFW